MKPGDGPTVHVAGVQYENESTEAYLRSFDEVLVKHSASQWIVCSEYSFPGPPTEEILSWAKLNNRYVSTGGVQMVPGQKFDKFYNTTFLTGPGGVVEHRQVKSVPIQFMDDGLPAPEQKVWESPWGKIGLCICYDMNYVRVTDELVRQGAQALVIPAMDLEKWGYAEHVLSARLGATRAVEYGLPVFRLASSGISQLIQADGTISAKGSFPGQGEIVAGEMKLGKGWHRPLDRWLAWPAVVLTGLVLLGLIGVGLRRRFGRDNVSENVHESSISQLASQ
jgi:apolipoprotein N-acyltransferase